MTNQEGSNETTVLSPSQWWCRWQAFKGANFRHLTIPSIDLRNKWIVITGGNSGVGREAALQFAKWGANIVLGCREPPPHEPHPDAVVEELRSAALDAGHEDTVFEWWECDMSILKSVEGFGKRWLERGQALDILVNNAGLGGVLGKTRYTVDGFELIHQVNFLSHVLLTKLLLPSLARAPSPRITCTTSCMQYFGTFDLSNANSGKNAYKNNKLYFQTWLTELQARMSEHDRYKHIVIQGLHPGYVNTNIWIGVSPEKSKSMGWLQWSLNVLVKYVAIDSQQGSLAITHAATASEWGSRHTENGKEVGGGGRYCNRIWEEEPMPQTRDPECRRKVWEFVNEELKLDEWL